MAQPAQPAPKPKLTPRELFYSAGPALDDTHSHKGTPKDQSGKGTKSTKGGVPKANPDATAHDSGELPGGGHIINASAGPPIGVTYTLQKWVGSDKIDVAPDSVFHKDDRIVFVVQTNYPGYLYIATRDRPVTGTPYFPRPKSRMATTV